MITELKIKNFKSIKDESLKLSSLNLITGINSSGKSTLLQSILLLKQINISKKTLSLNEHLVELGTIEDALHQFYSENKIEIGLTLNSKESF
ncbi:AAA family ATPase, partial [Enterobacter roggenkampii]